MFPEFLSAAAAPSSLRRARARREDAAAAPLLVVAMSMSFPPLLPSKTWRTPTVAPVFPGSSLTWRKAMAPRPLTHQPSAATVGELRLATRGNFALLNIGLVYLRSEPGGGVFAVINGTWAKFAAQRAETAFFMLAEPPHSQLIPGLSTPTLQRSD